MRKDEPEHFPAARGADEGKCEGCRGTGLTNTETGQPMHPNDRGRPDVDECSDCDGTGLAGADERERIAAQALADAAFAETGTRYSWQDFEGEARDLLASLAAASPVPDEVAKHLADARAESERLRTTAADALDAAEDFINTVTVWNGQDPDELHETLDTIQKARRALTGNEGED